MNRRKQLAQRALVLLAVTAVGVLVVRSRREVPPREAVAKSVETFCEHLEFGRINKAIRMLDPAFTFNGYTRSDISRGLAMNQRDTRELTITLVDLRVGLDEVTGQATAEMGVAISFFRGDHEVVIGEEHPVPVRIQYQQQGREWIPTRGEGDREIEALGYPF